MPVKLSSSGGGSVTLDTPSTASNYTVTLPAANATLADTSSTQTLTNKTLTAAGSNTVEATSGPTSSQLAGNRNKIINGAMMIDQRNAGASVSTVAAGGFLYSVDRFGYLSTQNAKFTLQQNAGSVTPPAGFTNYLGITSTSAYSVVASDFFGVGQPLEGLNVADLNWGTSRASPVTVSFWVRSSLTGTFGGFIKSWALAYQYVYTYTINAANTWEYKTITIPAPTSGSFPVVSNAAFAFLYFDLGSGTSQQSAASSSWQAVSALGVTGATSVVGTNGATFYITGVQLEKGATATPFENRLYGTELALCQRYYETNIAPGTAVGNNAAVTDRTVATNYYASYPAALFTYKVTKRANPTVTFYSGSNKSTVNGFPCYFTGSWVQATSVGLTGFSNANEFGVDFGASGLTLYSSYIMQVPWSSSAEL